MFRNESGNSFPSKTASSEQEILLVLQALLATAYVPAPLHRKVVEYIAICTNNELLKGLALHNSLEVRRAVASNRNLPDELFWKLADDAHFEVRARLAENIYLATFLLETLAEEDDDRIAARAQRTLDKQASDSLSDKVIHWMFAALPSRQIS